MAYFNIKSLENLSRDVNQNNYYDLFVQNYSSLESKDVVLRYYIVNKSREMRLDLVCADLYGDLTNLQMLMFINNIYNPFGIQESDVIFWIDSKDISKNAVVDSKTLDDGRNNLINAFKASQTDPNRTVYLQNRGTDQLPTNILNSNAPKILIDNNKILVGANLFSNPNNQVRNYNALNSNALNNNNLNNGNNGNVNSNNNSNNSNSSLNATDANGNVVSGVTSPTLTSSELNNNIDQTERVLVRTFIQSGN